MHWIVKIVLASLLFVLSGCAFKSSAPLSEYTLSVHPVSAVSSSYGNKTIKVIYPQPLKEKLSQAMVFSYSFSDRGVYQNSQWSNTVPRLIQGTVIEALDQSRLFKGVVSESSNVQEDYRLESTIYDFSHHIREEASYAVVSIKFTLIDTNTGKLRKSRKFSYKEFTKSVDARGYAEATDRAMDKLVRDLISWLR